MLLSATLAVLLAVPALSSQLERRSFYAGGGFGLFAASGSCPPGTASAACSPCCPTGFSVQETCATGSLTSACCPSGSSCAQALQATPFCADPTWVLWNTTTTGDYLCCLQNQVGTNNLECVSDLTVLAPSLSASKIGQPVPTGAAASLVGPSNSATSVATTAGSKASITSASVKTTTKNGVASLITSIIGDVTGKSNANIVRPINHDANMLNIFGMIMTAGGAAGFALIARMI